MGEHLARCHVLWEVMPYRRTCHMEDKFEWVKCLTGGMFYGCTCVIRVHVFWDNIFCRYNWYTSGMSCVASVCMNGKLMLSSLLPYWGFEGHIFALALTLTPVKISTLLGFNSMYFFCLLRKFDLD